MRPCLQDDGCTSSRSAGSLRLTEHIPRWRSFSATGATRRLDSSPIRGIVPADSGLARGFTHYQDYIFPELTAFKMAVLVSRALEGFQAIVYFTEDWLESAGLLPYVQRLWRSLDTDRKGAAVVNRELLDWLAQRRSRSGRFSLS